jgi:hypothetical protein
MKMNLDADIDLAQRLADAAGAAIRPISALAWPANARRTPALSLLPIRPPRSDARDPARRTPDDTIIGEEYGITATSGRSWVLDPIDGTAGFLAGRAIFGTLIALVVEGWPVLGVIDQPIAGERWVGASGRKTLLNGQPVRPAAAANWPMPPLPPPARIISATMRATTSWLWRPRPIIAGW